MLRSEIINILIKKINAKKYLEIGVYDGNNFRLINCDNKIGVDPDVSSAATHYLPSDEFFLHNKEKFDVVFIDGLHYAEQVYKDIVNSLEVLDDNGFVVCHDMNPIKEEHQIVPYQGGTWNGDCWKAFVKLRQERSDIEMYVIDTDHGCGVIKKGSQKTISKDLNLNWTNFVKNKKEWLNIISISDFIEKYNVKSVQMIRDIIIKELLGKYIMNPENPENNYNLGVFYEDIGQTASALSYYLRAAERTKNEFLQYECIIRSAMCFDKQGCRNFTVKGLLQHAIALQPTKPEGYYLLSKYYEKENKDGSWHDCYMISSIGNKVAVDSVPLRTSIDYPGKHALLFQKGLSAWWCGLNEESKNIFLYLYTCKNVNSSIRASVENNLKYLKIDLDQIKNNHNKKRRRVT